MAGKYEDWAPMTHPLRPEDCKLPELYLMEVSYTRGFERRPYRDATRPLDDDLVEYIHKPYDDKLTVRLRRGDNNYEAKFSFKGLDAGHFMELIKPLEKT